MNKLSDGLLRNNCNDHEISLNIKEYFRNFPNSTGKECCRVLGISYEKYGGRARKIKYDFIKWRKMICASSGVSNGKGRLLNRLNPIHRLEYSFKEPVPEDIVDVINERALPNKAPDIWYRSPNRNKQLTYFDSDIHVRIYPKSRNSRIFPRKAMSYEGLMVRVKDSFFHVLPSNVLFSDSFNDIINSLQVKSRHRVFPVGAITPFRNSYYRYSLGLEILADKSHPNYLEIHESWPTWIIPLLDSQRSQNSIIEDNTKAISEFASQIKSHLHVMEGIGKAVDRLNDATHNLAGTQKQQFPLVSIISEPKTKDLPAPAPNLDQLEKQSDSNKSVLEKAKIKMAGVKGRSGSGGRRSGSDRTRKIYDNITSKSCRKMSRKGGGVW